ncbi:MAG: hypothetical protein OXF56_06610 [Rhodobacteraceae bacterium]|nr:hypothetical protein [Paracoccaceae bacterium]
MTIELGRHMAGDRTEYSFSRAIKAPLQPIPYRTSLPFHDTPAGALRKAVSGLTEDYRLAVDEDHEPSEVWLVENHGEV